MTFSLFPLLFRGFVIRWYKAERSSASLADATKVRVGQRHGEAGVGHWLADLGASKIKTTLTSAGRLSFLQFVRVYQQAIETRRRNSVHVVVKDKVEQEDDQDTVVESNSVAKGESGTNPRHQVRGALPVYKVWTAQKKKEAVIKKIVAVNKKKAGAGSGSGSGTKKTGAKAKQGGGGKVKGKKDK